MNPIYLLLIIPGLLTWYAQYRVRKVYEQYRKVPNSHTLKGREIARKLLATSKLFQVKTEVVAGYLIDHYNPHSKKITLSAGIASSHSVTSLGIVAHEVGHALQDAQGYRYSKIRNQLAQRLGQVSQWSPLVFIGGVWFGIPILRLLGVFMLAAFTVFTLVTLPVEKNASDRAMELLKKSGIMAYGEEGMVRHVLRSAALTYLVGLLRQITTFLFVILMGLFAQGVIRF